MASWGTGSFENEDAQNFLRDLANQYPDDLKQILSHAAATEENAAYLPAPESSVVIAAAEVVATARGAPPQSVPRQITEWVRKIDGAPSAEMTNIARRAVNQVRLNSELKDLWLEAEGLNEWSASLRDLEERLTA